MGFKARESKTQELHGGLVSAIKALRQAIIKDGLISLLDRYKSPGLQKQKGNLKYLRREQISEADAWSTILTIAKDFIESDVAKKNMGDQYKSLSGIVQQLVALCGELEAIEKRVASSDDNLDSINSLSVQLTEPLEKYKHLFSRKIVEGTSENTQIVRDNPLYAPFERLTALQSNIQQQSAQQQSHSSAGSQEVGNRQEAFRTLVHKIEDALIVELSKELGDRGLQMQESLKKLFFFGIENISLLKKIRESSTKANEMMQLLQEFKKQAETVTDNIHQIASSFNVIKQCCKSYLGDNKFLLKEMEMFHALIQREACSLPSTNQSRPSGAAAAAASGAAVASGQFGDKKADLSRILQQYFEEVQKGGVSKLQVLFQSTLLEKPSEEKMSNVTLFDQYKSQVLQTLNKCRDLASMENLVQNVLKTLQFQLPNPPPLIDRVDGAVARDLNNFLKQLQAEQHSSSSRPSSPAR